MAFVMLIGSFSVLGSAYDAYKGTDIVDDYNDVDSPEFTLDQYASMGLDEVDRMLAKEQIELDLFGLLYLDITSINATIISVEQFLETGDVLLDMLGDLKTLPDAEWEYLQGLDCLIVNALRHEAHDTHQSLADALLMAGRVGAKQTWLIHMSHQIGLHAEVERSLPPAVHLAYDGVHIEV